MARARVVLVGFIGKLPYAGMSLWNLHYIAGLQDLGYDVFYVENLNYPDEYYDPAQDAMTSDTSFALQYLRELLPKYGVPADQFCLMDGSGECSGAGRPALHDALDQADFVLTIGTSSWFDELERCPRRAFLECDPVFTQSEMIEGGLKASVMAHYDTLFTSGTLIGTPGCTIPNAGREWITTRTVVASRLWTATPPPPESAPITALLHWAAGRDAILNGQAFGHKNREFERFISLPKLSSHPFTLAVSGNAPRPALEDAGWNLISPLGATATIPDYLSFLENSYADFGIAKHAYVATRCGWFSDRSTCYLAAGRPVLHQDTGFRDWLPTGAGVLAFSEMKDLLDGLRCLELDYPRHCKAARRLVEEHFEARDVIAKMLEDAGYR